MVSIARPIAAALASAALSALAAAPATPPPHAEPHAQREASTTGLARAGLMRASHARRFQLDAPSPDVVASELGAPSKHGVPLRIGFARDVPGLHTETASRGALDWERLDDGARVAQVMVTSASAAAVRVGLRATRLPADAIVRFRAPGDDSLYETTGREIADTIARNAAAGDDSADGRTYWSPIVDGDTIAIEIEIPAGDDPLAVHLSIPRVAHLATSAAKSFSGVAKSSQTCEIDAMCTSGWTNQMNAVAKMIFTDGVGWYVCTGTLLADQDPSSNVPYFLSANHCINTQSAASSLATYWFYRSSACNSGVAGPSQQLTGGATLLYHTTSTDTSFMRLNNLPPQGTYFAGWSTSGPLGLGSGVSALHNPAGDLLKYSVGSVANYVTCTPTSNDQFSCSLANASSSTFYDISWGQGLTEPGSSGSGIFLNGGYLVGQLYGGGSSCTGGGDDFYGRFDVAYRAGLSQWLSSSALTVTRSGTGTGTVTSSPTGINCGTTCSATYPNGTTVTLTAASGAGSIFSGWGGACSGAGACTLTLNSAASVTATFATANGTLSVLVNGEGSVSSSPAGIDNCTGACSATFPGGSVVGLSATPAPGAVFAGWSGACSGSEACSVAVSGSVTIGASFTAPVTSSTTLFVSPASTWIGQAFTAIATVSGSSGTATGTVAFMVDGASVAGCAAVTLSSGSAACPIAGLGMGSHAVVASYSGGGIYRASTSTSAIESVAPGRLEDFNGDRRADLMWRSAATGDLYRMTMNGLSITGGGLVYREPNLAWKVVADGDFNGDGVADLLWRNDSSGNVYMQFFNTAGAPSSGAVMWIEPDPAWHIVATPDFDGDGRADILWWNSSTGAAYAQQMNGTTIVASGTFYVETDTRWKIVAVGDFSGSGRRNQLLWRNAATGQVYLMTVTLSGGVFSASGQQIYQEPNLGWKIVAAADFDGDGRSDILWRNDATGAVYVMLMNGPAIAAGAQVHQEPNLSWTIAAVADYDGDGRADLLWRNESTGQVYMMLMNGLAIVRQGYVYSEPDTSWKILGAREYRLP